MSRPRLAHHVELQFHICGQLLEHLQRVVLIHEQVRKKTGQSLPIAVSGIAEVAQHHYHREDDLTLGGFLLWSHTAIYHGPYYCPSRCGSAVSKPTWTFVRSPRRRPSLGLPTAGAWTAWEWYAAVAKSAIHRRPRRSDERRRNLP